MRKHPQPPLVTLKHRSDFQYNFNALKNFFLVRFCSRFLAKCAWYGLSIRHQDCKDTAQPNLCAFFEMYNKSNKWQERKRKKEREKNTIQTFSTEMLANIIIISSLQKQNKRH